MEFSSIRLELQRPLQRLKNLMSEFLKYTKEQVFCRAVQPDILQVSAVIQRCPIKTSKKGEKHQRIALNNPEMNERFTTRDSAQPSPQNDHHLLLHPSPRSTAGSYRPGADGETETRGCYLNIDARVNTNPRIAPRYSN